MVRPNESNRPEGLSDAASMAGESASRLGEQSKKVLEDVRELGATAAQSVGEAAQRLRTQGGDLLEEGKERFHRVQGNLEHYISSHPTKSVLLALGAGALIGMLFFRRSR
jgi:ElaB/YqjD/DUF883 family membrane-anchored ribosome-binding protein